MRPSAFVGHLELAVDRHAVSFMDDISQRAHSRSAEEVDRLS